MTTAQLISSVFIDSVSQDMNALQTKIVPSAIFVLKANVLLDVDAMKTVLSTWLVIRSNARIHAVSEEPVASTHIVLHLIIARNAPVHPIILEIHKLNALSCRHVERMTTAALDTAVRLANVSLLQVVSLTMNARNQKSVKMANVYSAADPTVTAILSPHALTKDVKIHA